MESQDNLQPQIQTKKANKYTVLVYSIIGVVVSLVIVLFAVYLSNKNPETTNQVSNNSSNTATNLNKEEENLDSVDLDGLGEDDLRQLDVDSSGF